MANTLNTRIVLKNDALSNWISSSVKLLKGEIALAQRADGNFEARVGTGDKTWNELSTLSGQIIIPAANVEGLTSTIAALSTSFYEVGALSDLTATSYVNGDFAVVTSDIDGTHTSYTAYRYDSTAKAWKALDGNYSAENVYFSKDIDLAGSYTRVGNIEKSGATGTLTAKGKSVKEIFDKIFDQTVQPTLGSAPTNSVTLNEAGSYEVGTVKTPTYSVSFSQGKYNTPWVSTTATVSDGTTATAYSVTDGTSTATRSSGSFASITVGDSTSYKLTSETTYSDGTVAKDNKGNNSDPEVKRTAGTTAKASSGTISGYRKPFWGTKTLDTKLDVSTQYGLTSNDIRTLGHDGSSTRGLPTSWRIPAGTAQIIFACKAGTFSSVSVSDITKPASPSPITFTKLSKWVKVKGVNDYAETDYDIFEAHMASGYAADAPLTITWA